MATKLLLIEDVLKLGRSGDLVNVKEGYARNYLLRGLAVTATKNALRRQTALQQARSMKAAEDKKQAEEQAKVLNGKVIETSVKVDPEGNMYGSVTAADIVQLLEAQLSLTLEKKSIVLKHAIKQVGVHKIELRLKEDVPAEITLKVHPEGGALPEEPAAAPQQEAEQQ